MFQVVMQSLFTTNEKYQSFDSEIIAVSLFEKFKLAVPYHFRKEEPLLLVATYGTIVYGNTLLKGQILEKSMKTTTVYTFVSSEFLFW